FRSEAFLHPFDGGFAGFDDQLAVIPAAVNPRKSNPSPRWTILVFSSLKERPLGASHAASFALTCSASCLERLAGRRPCRGRAQIARFGTAVGDHYSDPVAAHIDGTARLLDCVRHSASHWRSMRRRGRPFIPPRSHVKTSDACWAASSAR